MNESELRKKISDYKFYSYGTTRVFEKRANRLKSLRTWITFLGLVTPVIVGSMVLSFGFKQEIMLYLMALAGVVGTIQLVLSTWSIVARWDESYEYSVESLRANTDIYNKFKSLDDEQDVDKLHQRYLLHKKFYEEREFKDLGQNIQDKEKRFANHEALLYFGQKCHMCKEIPASSKPTTCNACGNY